ncbi:MAG: hypothetical protein ACLUJG_10820 [Lawsonibacter sp.]
MLAEGQGPGSPGGTRDQCGQAEHCCGRRCRRRGGERGPREARRPDLPGVRAAARDGLEWNRTG